MHAAEELKRMRPAWPLVVIATAYLYFFAGSYYGVYSVGVRTASVALLAIAFGAWTITAWRRPAWRPASVLWPAFAIALGALAIATLTSGNIRVSLDYLGYSVILAALYLLLRQVMVQPDLRRRMTGLVMLLTTAMLIAYLAVVVSRWLTWWGLVGEVAAPPLRPFFEGLSYGNPGAVAALAVLGLIVSVVHVGTGSRRAIGWLVVQTALTVLVVVITGSRASWLAIAVTFAFIALAVVVLPQGRAAIRGVLGSRPGRVGAVAAAVGVLILAVTVGPRVLERFLSGGTESERASFAVVSLRMAADKPLAGVGPGMWAPERIAYTQPPEVDYYIPHAHNLFTQTLAELGLLGAAAGVVVFGFGLALLRRAMRDADPSRRRWAWAAAIATVYLLVHQLLDLFANMPAILFVFAVPWAWIDATELRPLLSVAAPRRARTAALLVGGVVVMVAVAWSGVAERSAVAMDAALTATERGDAAGARELLEDADRVDPRMPAHLLPLGLAQATVDPDAALATFTRLAESDDLPTAWINRAALEVQLGRDDEARLSLERALRLGRQQANIALAAGWLYEQLGDTAAADEWYAAALAREPRLARDDFWDEQARAERWREIRADALAQLSGTGQLAFALAEDLPGGPAAIVLGNPDAASSVLQLVVAAWDGNPAAVDALFAYTRDNPLDTEAAGWSARVAARTGDLEAAQRYRDWANITWGQTGNAGAEVGIVPAPDRDALLAGINSVAWGIYTYRRSTPSDQLLPGLPHMVLTQ